MRSYDPDDKYDRETAEEMGAPEWMLSILSLNPSYVSWGPPEDYMWVKGDGWNSPLTTASWAEFDAALDELNEVVNFYFEIGRDSKQCETCGGEGYHPDAQWISESFYSHSSPFKFPTQNELDAKRLMESFGGPGPRSVVRGFFPDTPVMIKKYGHAFIRCCQHIVEHGGFWNDDITEDEAEALVEAGRGRLDNLKTAAEFNAAQGGRGFGGHDAINRSILVRQRCKRLGVPIKCPTCSGNGYVYTSSDCHLGLILWYILPRKGASRGWEIKNVLQSELPAVYAFLTKAAQRNQERFAKVAEQAKLVVAF